MINFKEEITKYRKALEIDDVEEAIRSDESKDALELLQQLANYIKTTGKE